MSHCVVSLSKTRSPLLLVQPRKTGNHPNVAENLLTGTYMYSINTFHSIWSLQRCEHLAQLPKRMFMHEKTCLICILSQLWSADGSDWTVMRGWRDIRSFTNAIIGKIMSLHCYLAVRHFKDV